MRVNSERKTVIIDASSAILVYKAGLLGVVAGEYRIITARSVRDELTVAGRDGTEQFINYFSSGEIETSFDFKCCLPALPLRGGEKDAVLLYLSGGADFIIMDDGEGAAYCRANSIPFINALLVSRVLFLSGRIGRQAMNSATDKLLRIGRYAEWVVEYARTCSTANLQVFFP
jgi:hypothetical protein